MRIKIYVNGVLISKKHLVSMIGVKKTDWFIDDAKKLYAENIISPDYIISVDGMIQLLSIRFDK